MNKLNDKCPIDGEPLTADAVASISLHLKNILTEYFKLKFFFFLLILKFILSLCGHLRTLVTCKFKPNGCNEFYRLDQILSHEADCKYYSVRCEKGCESTVAKDDVEVKL